MAACIALNLLDNDQHWHDTMQDAIHNAMPYSIRLLFANILLFCNPSDPRALFDAYADSMCDDFRHQ
jgi:hypothetical protein